MRLIASLALGALLVSCQTLVAPGPNAYPASTATPAAATSSFPPQPTSAITGTVAGSWGKIPDMPVARAGAATVVFENRIVVIGGIGGAQRVDRYDPKTKAWDRLADLPVGVELGMAAAIDEGVDAGLFLFGGFVNGLVGKRSWYLPRDDDRWREINSMPENRAAGAAVTVGTKVYIVGGATNQQPSVQSLAANTLMYDLHGPIGAPWSVKAPIPTPRDQLAAGAIDGKVCALGGREYAVARSLAAVECYDPATDKWEQLPPLPAPRSATGAAVVGDRVVVVGGDEATGPVKTVVIYETRARAWSRGPDLAAPRLGLMVVAAGGLVYAIGGIAPGGNTPMAVGEVLTLR